MYGVGDDVDIKNEIDYFGLYDCYPIAFIFGLLSTEIVDIDNLSQYLEKWYSDKDEHKDINTHGGLSGFGASGYVPCGFSIIEGIKQMRFEADKDKQISYDNPTKNGMKGLIVGNGAVLQFGAAMIIDEYSHTMDDISIISRS